MPRDLTLQAGEELLARHSLAVLKVPDPELGELLGLHLAQKPEKLLHIHRKLAIIRRRISREPTGPLGMRKLGKVFGFPARESIRPSHVLHDQRFESFFGGVAAHLVCFCVQIWLCEPMSSRILLAKSLRLIPRFNTVFSRSWSCFLLIAEIFPITTAGCIS